MHIGPKEFYHQMVRCLHLSRNIWVCTKRKIHRSKEFVIVGSAHKVGSTWLYQLLRDYCCLNGYILRKYVAVQEPQQQNVNIDLREILAPLKVPVGGHIHKTHSYPPPDTFVSQLPGWVKFVTMIRDPRDVLVSSSFYLANLPEDQGGWGGRFRSLNPKMRIIQILKEGEFLKSRLRNWYQCNYAYNVRYEQLLSDTHNELKKLLSFLNIDVVDTVLSYNIQKCSFKKLSGRRRGQEDRKAFLRKGISGDWKNYFDEEVKEAYKNSCDGDWNNLLIELAYEKNKYW